jgi:hypothetical protein
LTTKLFMTAKEMYFAIFYEFRIGENPAMARLCRVNIRD